MEPRAGTSNRWSDVAERARNHPGKWIEMDELLPPRFVRFGQDALGPRFRVVCDRSEEREVWVDAPGEDTSYPVLPILVTFLGEDGQTE